EILSVSPSPACRSGQGTGLSHRQAEDRGRIVSQALHPATRQMFIMAVSEPLQVGVPASFGIGVKAVYLRSVPQAAEPPIMSFQSFPPLGGPHVTTRFRPPA